MILTGEFMENEIKQKLPRYEMHKYWGKKPSKDLNELIKRYSKEGDLVLDPFAGYGVFICEAFILGRNVIGNDLNPASNFILDQLLNINIDLTSFETIMKNILVETDTTLKYWYNTDCPNCNKKATILATLRKKDGTPLLNKLKCSCTKNAFTQKFTEEMVQDLLSKEQNIVLENHPNQELIKNGRISALAGMKTDDLFTTRALACHSIIYNKINNIDNIDIKNLAKFTFTSNLANCSKLVPPIKSRGEVSPGTWMTGFYIAEEYLEQNVFHYLENRISKIIAGKKDYFNVLSKTNLLNKQKVYSIDNLEKNTLSYLITNYDAKKIQLPDNSVDYIFTDPPYGDTVPYFEQSALWNTWLQNSVDYSNEIVVSDSKERTKTMSNFQKDIYTSIHEIYRILKNDSFFSITYHSVSGKEWYALTTACLEAGFQLYDFSLLLQKSFSPRQLNTKKTVKGDVLITFKKSTIKKQLIKLDILETQTFIYKTVKEFLGNEKKTTNAIYEILLKKIFSNHILFSEINFIEELSKHFKFDDDGLWYYEN